MANISLLSRLVNGVQRQVDLSANVLVVSDLQINGINLRSTGSGTAGSTGIGDDNSYSHFTPTAATVKGALSGIDSALGSISGFANQQLSNLTGTVAVNLSLTPGTDNSINIGSAAKSWAAANIHVLNDGSSVASVDVYNRLLKDAAGVASVDFANRALKDSSAATQLTWSTSGLQLTANALDFNSHKGINLTDPTSAQDAATKNYVDNLAHGLSWKQVVRAASTGNLNLASMPATVDGVTLNANDRFLAKDQSTSSQNGIYVFNGAGSAATRSLDANTATELTWATVEVGADSATQAGYIFRESDDITTIGTDPVAFVIISHGLDWTFNNGLSTTGNQVNVVPGDSSLTATPGSLVVALNAAGAIVTSSGLMINLATTNPGLAITTNKLDVKYNPAGAIVASSTGIAWNPDGSSLEISSNAARIKTTAYDQATITGGGGSAAAVAYAPAIKIAGTAGQTFSANTTYALRYGLPANGETAGRLYAADITASSFDLFWVVGFLPAGTGFSAGNAILYVESGVLTLGSSDTNFGVNDPGKPIFLQSGGTQATTTAPSTTGQAVAAIGMVLSTTSFKVMIRAPYVY